MRLRRPKRRHHLPWHAEVIPFPTKGSQWLAVAAACAGMFWLALRSDPGANRVWVALVAAFSVALPFCLMLLVQSREWQAALLYRQGQLLQLRSERAWRNLSAYELRDRLALLFHLLGHHIGALTPSGEGGEWTVAAQDEHGYEERFEVSTAAEAASADQAAAFVGRCLADGAESGIFICLGGFKEEARVFARRLAPERFALQLLDADGLVRLAADAVPDVEGFLKAGLDPQQA